MSAQWVIEESDRELLLAAIEGFAGRIGTNFYAHLPPDGQAEALQMCQLLSDLRNRISMNVKPDPRQLILIDFQAEVEAVMAVAGQRF